jgi:hypothetical protein
MISFRFQSGLTEENMGPATKMLRKKASFYICKQCTQNFVGNYLDSCCLEHGYITLNRDFTKYAICKAEKYAHSFNNG